MNLHFYLWTLHRTNHKIWFQILQNFGNWCIYLMDPTRFHCNFQLCIVARTFLLTSDQHSCLYKWHGVKSLTISFSMDLTEYLSSDQSPRTAPSLFIVDFVSSSQHSALDGYLQEIGLKRGKLKFFSSITVAIFSLVCRTVFNVVAVSTICI